MYLLFVHLVGLSASNGFAVADKYVDQSHRFVLTSVTTIVKDGANVCPADRVTCRLSDVLLEAQPA